MEFCEEEIEIKMVYALHRRAYYNKRHTPIKNVCNRLSYIPCKQINKAVKKLHKKGIIGIKKTFHGADIYLNHKKKAEIQDMISTKLSELNDF